MTKVVSKPIFVPLPEVPTSSFRRAGERTVALNVAALREVLKSDLRAHADELDITFNLFDDLTLSLRTELIEPFGDGGVVWRGMLPGVPNVRGYLAVSGLGRYGVDLFSAAGAVEFNGSSFLISPAGNRLVRIGNGEQGSAHSCGDAPRDVGKSEPAMSDDDGESAEGEVSVLGDGMPDGNVIIHVLALYPTGTKNAIQGGALAIDTIMAFAQLQTNEIFSNSGIAARVEITTQELPALRHTDVVDLLTEVVGAHDGVVRDGKPKPEVWDAVTAAREKAQASIVCLLTDLSTKYAGGTVNGAASRIPEPPRVDQTDLTFATFSMSLISKTSAGYLFAHELGHLLGGKHDRYTMHPDEVPLDRKYDYVRGYSPVDWTFVTVMGYSRPGTPLVPAYSAADKTWGDKPLGIPVGQPEAADAARFFRSIVSVVANYRGAGARRRWVPVDVQFSVVPLLGGTIIPGAFGPYPEGSQVKVTAVPRIHFEFSHWTLDGKEIGKEPTTTISADRAHALTAHFNAGKGLIAPDVIQPPADADVVIRLIPPGGSYPLGTNVEVELVGDDAKYMLDHWIIDGQPASQRLTMTLQMERSHSIQARLRTSEHFVQALANNAYIEAGATRTLKVKVFHKQSNVPIAHQWLTFTLTDAGTGSRLEGLARVQTDMAGEASVVLHAGQHKGHLSVSASLDDTDARPALFELTVPRYVLVPTRDIYRIGPDDPPTTIEALMHEEGRAVSGVEITFYLKASPETTLPHGVAMLPARATTDEHGIARTTLNHTASSVGKFEIHAVYIGKDASPTCYFSVQGICGK